MRNRPAATLEAYLAALRAAISADQRGRAGPLEITVQDPRLDDETLAQLR